VVPNSVARAVPVIGLVAALIGLAAFSTWVVRLIVSSARVCAAW
jgi:hypothetical protein